MDESPRASKRRKLEVPSSVRKSTRTTRTTYKADGSPKNIVKEDADVWDDIEGALGDSPTKQLPSAKKRSTRKTLANGSASNNGTPKARSGRTSAGFSALKPPTTAPLKTAEEDTEGQDDGEVATPSRRTSKRTPLASTRKPKTNKATNDIVSPIKPGSLRKPRSRVQAEVVLDAEEPFVLATPSSRRKRQPRFRDDETIPETDEEPAARQPSASKQSSARRQANRADNTRPQGETWAHAGEKYGSPIPEESDDDAMSVDGNSILGSVLDPTEPSPFNKPSSAQKERPEIPPLLTFIQPGHELDLLKTIVLDRISGKRSVPVVGLDDAYKSVHQLVEHTVTAGEGNSMLLIGARGSGKTALVNKVLAEVSKDNAHEYHVVRLNGFVHTDDKIALREIWRQLGKEMELEEEGGGVGKNYADTLTTLLALLSHPSEHTGEYTDQVAKAVIFIMDEFDLFAQHPRQTLLYNLFDIAQSRKAPIAVLGLTTRIDVANSLEKRVKSRFSHRYVHLSLAKTFTAFQEICKANLLVQPESLTIEERGILESATKTSRKTTTSASTVLSQWNSSIDTLFLSKSFLTAHLAPLFYRSKSIPTTLTTFLLPTASLTTSLAPSTALTPPDAKLALIPHLSTLALSLLIAACRLDIIHDSDTCNFNMAYDEYVTLASRARIQSAAGGNSASGAISKVWTKEVARREWEALVALGLIIPALLGGGVGSFGMVRCDVSLEEVGGVLRGCKGEKALERWCRQI